MTRRTRKSVEEYPWAEVVNWHRHQPPQADQGKFIRNMTRLLVKGRYRLLTPAERGLLHSIWLLRSLGGSNVPRASETLREALGLPAGRWFESAMWTLEHRGWLVPRKGKHTGPRRDGADIEDGPEAGTPLTEAMRSGSATVRADLPPVSWKKKRPEPDVENVLGATPDQHGQSASGPCRSRVALPKRGELPTTNPHPTPEEGSQQQPNREAALHQRRESRGERENQGPESSTSKECTCNGAGVSDGVPCAGCVEGQKIKAFAVRLFTGRGQREGWTWESCVERSISHQEQPEREAPR